MKQKQNWNKICADNDEFVLFQFCFGVLAHVKQNAETKQKLGAASYARLAVGLSQAG